VEEILYDAIIIGARVAGAPTAMLLAQKGHKVLLVDRDTFPSDIMSTHALALPAIQFLHRWGLYETLVAKGCRPITKATLSATGGPPRTAELEAMCPRRYVLDEVLVRAAVEAGAELREGLTLHRRIIFSFPTNDGLTCLAFEAPKEEFQEFRSDIEGNFNRTLQLVPDLADRARGAERQEPFKGMVDVPNFFRKPYGHGWALVGDAGYNKDPVTGLGIGDAFRDAELLAEALDAGLSGLRPPPSAGSATRGDQRDPADLQSGSPQTLQDALADYEARRNAAARATYDLTCRIASFPPPAVQMLLMATSGDPEALALYGNVVDGKLPFNQFISMAMANMAAPA
jgi:flavin-dependent dehydrogenase